MHAPSVRAAETQEPEEWIFSVVMPPQWSIAQDVFVYQYKDSFYLPIVEMANGFEFFIEAETNRSYASGFAGNEENTYTIDGERGELLLKGEKQELPEDAILHDDLLPEGDLYVRLDILNKIWPVEMQVSFSDVTIYVEAEEELSFIRRKAREEKQTVFKAQKEAAAHAAEGTLPYRENAYQWFGKPVLDLQSSYTYDNNAKRLTGTNTVTGTQQLTKFIADYGATYSYRDGQLIRPDSIKARFSRQAQEDDYLLLPSLKRFEFGDINIGQRDLIGTRAAGRGIVFSNHSSVREYEFDRITVEGRGPPGWELELYNNNTLLELGAIDQNGEYRFENVVLNFGNNRIRVVMYGPQGQIREEVKEYQIAGSLLSPGEFRYRGGIVDTSRSLIQLEDEPSPTDPHVAKGAEAAYGINKWLTLLGSYTKVPFQGKEEQYVTTGASFSTPVGVGDVERYKQVNGGSAVDARFITKILGVRLNTRAAFFNDFESEEAGTGTGARRFQAEVRAGTRLDLPFLPMNLNVDLERSEFVDGSTSMTLGTSQSYTGGGVRLSHTTSSQFLNDHYESSSGGAGISWQKRNWQTQGGVSYKMYPEAVLSAANAELRYSTPDNFQASLTTQHNFLDSVTQYGAQVGYDFKNILATLDAQYRDERGWQFTLRAATSLHPYTSDREYTLSSRSHQGMAPVLGRVFLDRDRSGTFTQGDEPLEGARLSVDKTRSQEESDQSGTVVTLLPADEIAGVAVDESSLKDPYYRAAVPGYRTTGLKGVMPGFDFPVVETGSIDGTVINETTGKAVPGMKLQLLNEAGEIFMESETAFDGYYAFEFVVPGTYTVQADPSYQVNVPAETVTVSSEELFAYGVDLYLLEPAAEESAADQASGESGGIAQLSNHAPAVSGTTQPAPVNPQDEGSSFIPGEHSEESDSPAGEERKGGFSYPAASVDSGGGAPALGLSIVKDVRIGESPDEVRLVLDLTAPASYDVKEGDGLIILIDLPGSKWEAQAARDMKYSPVLSSYATETLPGKGTRLILKSRSAMTVREHKLLPAENGKPDRLILDLKKK